MGVRFTEGYVHRSCLVQTYRTLAVSYVLMFTHSLIFLLSLLVPLATPVTSPLLSPNLSIVWSPFRPSLLSTFPAPYSLPSSPSPLFSFLFSCLNHLSFLPSSLPLVYPFFSFPLSLPIFPYILPSPSIILAYIPLLPFSVSFSLPFPFTSNLFLICRFPFFFLPSVLPFLPLSFIYNLFSVCFHPPLLFPNT